MVLYTDAATKGGGIGGFIDMDNGSWFQADWPEIHQDPTDIMFAELVAIIIAFEKYKERWRNKSIKIWCDNAPIVGILVKKKACLIRTDVQAFVRILLQICNLYNIKYVIYYIKSEDNPADAVSRMEPYSVFKDRDGVGTLAPKATPVLKEFEKYVILYKKLHKNVKLKECGVNCDCGTMTLNGKTFKACYFY